MSSGRDGSKRKESSPGDGARSPRVAKAVRAGIVWVNTHRAVSPIAEFGGLKGSGLALIKTTWRMVYVLATLNRDRVIDTRQENELDDIVAVAREVMEETMNEGPTPAMKALRSGRTVASEEIMMT